MTAQYDRLISLAEELEASSSVARASELNSLLSATSVADVKEEHFSLLDGLISTMSITGNLSQAHEASILQLLEDIRSRASA